MVGQRTPTHPPEGENGPTHLSGLLSGRHAKPVSRARRDKPPPPDRVSPAGARAPRGTGMYSRMSLASELMMSSQAEGGAPSAPLFYRGAPHAEDAPAPAHWSLETIAWDPVDLRAETRSASYTAEGEELTRCTPGAPGAAALLPMPLPPSSPHADGATPAPSGGSGGSGRSDGRPTRRGDSAACVALGCSATLQGSGSSARSRLCASHLRAPSFVLASARTTGPQRWCQKCNRSHDLSAYSGEQRTCVAALAIAAARRRQRTAERAAARREHAASVAATSAAEDSGSDAPQLSPHASAAHAAPRRSLPGADDGDFEGALARAFGTVDGVPGAMEPAATDEAYQCGLDAATASLLFAADAALMQSVQPRGAALSAAVRPDGAPGRTPKVRA